MTDIVGTIGNDTLIGTTPDPFFGTGGNDTIYGFEGNDIIDGLGGLDTLDGGTGDDTFLFTVATADRNGVFSHIYGGDGIDTLDFSRFAGRGVLGPGNPFSPPYASTTDLLVTGLGITMIASGIERVIGSANGNGFAFRSPIAEVIGGPGADYLNLNAGGTAYGFDGNDGLIIGGGGIGYAGAGSDLLRLNGGQIFGEDGDDYLLLSGAVPGSLADGGSGVDQVEFALGDIVDLGAGTLTRPSTDGTPNTMSIVNFENAVLGPVNTTADGPVTTVYGTDGDNLVFFALAGLQRSSHLYGRGGDDNLAGSAGFDSLDGGDGNDTVAGGTGNNLLIGGAGIDTARIAGLYADSLFSFVGDHVDVIPNGGQTPSDIAFNGVRGIDRLVGIEKVQFSDGVVIDRADGNPLVDDLFYLANNRDVFADGIDADTHFALYGWQEGRDPNALFDVSGYLAANPDVAALHGDPLAQYVASGAAQGRDPSAAFDSEQYLARNPDVAIAGANPLAHYLEYGQSEGRAIYAAVGTNLIGDFDPEYYILSNADVAAAGVDPFQHYTNFGASEGRDPNSYFDISYYLEHNPDVAAARVDPLLHYETYGWHEGRDPSALFDTSYYLDHNLDVAAAGIDPLEHYLLYGRLEGREPIADLTAMGTLI